MSLLVDKETQDKRWEICKGCDRLSEKNFCKLCGCFMPVKVKLKTVACPMGKWLRDKNYTWTPPWDLK